MIRNLLLSIVAILAMSLSASAQEVVPVNHGGPVVIHGQSCATGNCGTCASCATCVSVPTTTKHTTWVYGSVCKEICLSKCSTGSLFGGGCGCEANCGRQRTVHTLTKRKCETEHCTTQCVPASQGRATSMAPAPMAPAAPMVAPEQGQKAPAPLPIQ